MVLRPLEFVDCLLDSPYFRENLHNHEREVESTSKAIKLIVQQCKQLIDRTRDLSKAHRLFAASLSNFQSHFSVLSSDQTDDEADLESSLKEISTLLINIEDEREQMLTQLEESFIKPMDRFRKTEIGNAKEEKKKFDKQTAKYCVSLERYLGAKANKLGDDKQLEETANAQLRQDYNAFIMTSMNYVKVVQEVQERKNFIVADSLNGEYNLYRECAMTYTQQLQLVQLSKRVEILESLLRFMNQQMVFYHLGYEIFENFKPYTCSLQAKIQKLRAAFESTTSEAENLKRKMLMNPKEYMRTSQYKGSTLTGYLLIMKKQKAVLNSVWSKHFCEYSKDTRIFRMVQYSQSSGMPKMLQNMEKFTLKSCVRIGSEVYDRRFCFTVMLEDQSQKQQQLVLQAPDDNELRLWLDAMEGKEPIEQAMSVMSAAQGQFKLSENGFRFIQQCINAVESRGLTEAGLYRVVGLASKVEKLLSLGIERDVSTELMDPETDLKVITSAIKQYFRRLTEPVMTFTLHSGLILAAKQDSPQKRASSVHVLVHRLPEDHFTILKMLMQHLYKVACHSSQNLMTVSNLGVCFGPTLLRQREETMAAIMDIKFCNVVVEILIENYHQIFETAPPTANIGQLHVSSAVNKPTVDDVLTSASSAAASAAIANRQPGASGPAARLSERAGENSAFFTPPRSSTEYREVAIECEGLQTHSAFSSSKSTTVLPPDTGGAVSMLVKNLPRPGDGRFSKSGLMASRFGVAGVQTKIREGTEKLPFVGTWNKQVSDAPSGVGQAFEQSVPSTAPASTDEASAIQRQQQKQPSLEVKSAPSSSSHSRTGPDIPSSSSSQPPNLRNPSNSPFANRRQMGPVTRTPRRVPELSKRAKALYDCVGDTEGELSFKSGDVIENVRESSEEGWLEGTINGQSGLIPANFVVLL